MGSAPTILLPTAAYQPAPGQASPAYAILIDDVAGHRSLMSLEGRVVAFPNEYRAMDVLGWADQHARVRMTIVPHRPAPDDLPVEEWERRQQGSYVHYSQRRRMARLGLAGM